MDSDQFNILLDKMDVHTEKLNSLHVDFSEFKGEIAAKVSALEKRTESDRLWGRIQTVAVLPIVTALHIVAKKFGV